MRENKLLIKSFKFFLNRLTRDQFKCAFNGDSLEIMKNDLRNINNHYLKHNVKLN